MAGNVAPDPQGPPAGQEGVQFLLQAVNSLFSDYGWYIFFGLIVVYLLVQKLSKNLQGAKQSSVPTTTIEPDNVVKQQEALLAARMKMQEQLNVQAEKFKEKQKMLEEEKRKQKIAMWENMQEGKSYKATLQQNQEPKPGASTSTTVVKPKPNRKPYEVMVITPCLEKVVGHVRGDQDAEGLPRVDEANSPGVVL